MPAPRIRGDYEQLTHIAQTFGTQADQLNATLQRLKAAQGTLAGGDWVGEGARKFYEEMDAQVQPVLQRLVNALQQAQQVTGEISRIIKQAEDDAAACFKLEAGEGRGSGSGGGAGEESIVGDVIGGIIGGLTLGAVGATAGPVGLVAGLAIGATVGAMAGDAIEDAIEGENSSSPSSSSETPTVTPEVAQQMFDDMRDEADIAFNYPVDGCYARAHMMNERIAERYGYTPDKAWAFGDLQVNTNTPYGEISWGYHVAPVVHVKDVNGNVTPMVLDPSIESGPVTVAQWQATMGDANAITKITKPGESPTGDGGGYFPGSPDPTAYGGPDGYSAEVMQRYRECGESGDMCDFVYPYE